MFQDRSILINKLFAVILLTVISLGTNNILANGDSLKIEVLLTKKIISETGLNDNLINCFDFTKSNLITIASGSQFYLVGWGGLKPLGKKTWGEIKSFAFNSQGGLMAIRNNELCYLDSTGNLVKFISLPNHDMAISKGEYLMYVYDRNASKASSSVYAILQGGKYTKLLEVPKKINTLSEFKNSIYFTNENAIFKYTLSNKELKAIVALPNKKEIKSFCIDSTSERIYFSTDSVIYSIKDTALSVVTNKMNGVLSCFGNSLVIFDYQKKSLIRLIGINAISNKNNPQSTQNNIPKEQVITTPTLKAISPATTTQTTNTTSEPTKPSTNPVIPSTQTTKTITPNTSGKEIITNVSVIKMTKAKLSDDLIIDVINTSEVNFDLTVESMVNLSNNGVSSTVIKEMKNAMAKKNAK